jgi:hypothetical protein
MAFAVVDKPRTRADELRPRRTVDFNRIWR